MSYLGTFQGLLSKYLTLSYIPPQYQWMIPFALIALALLMLFKSKDSWRIVIGLIGFAGAYFEVMNLITTYQFSLSLFGAVIPPYLLAMLAGVAAMVLLYFIVELAILLAFGYVTYYLLAVHYSYSLQIAIPASLLAFGIAFIAYQKIVSVMAKFIGAVIMFVALAMMNVPTMWDAIITVILFAVAFIFMVYGRKIRAKYNRWRGREQEKEIMEEKAEKKAKWRSKHKAKGGEKGMGIAKKVISGTVGKIPHPHLHKKEKVDESAETAQTVEEPKVTRVRKE